MGKLGSTQAIAGLLASSVDVGTTIVTEVQTFETTWGVLLLRLELFNKIVTDTAAVTDVHLHPLGPLAHHLNLIDSFVCVAGLLCYISGEQSLSIPDALCSR